jgi:hypothetical protein
VTLMSEVMAALVVTLTAALIPAVEAVVEQ